MDLRTSTPLSVAEAEAVLGPLLPQLSGHIKRASERRPGGDLVLDAGLGPRHATLLGLLVRGPLTVSQIAHELRLRLPTVSGVVADLDRAQLVERRADPADRRRTIVSLRADRADDVRRWRREAAAPIVAVLEQLTPDERAGWVKGTQLLVGQLLEPAGELRRPPA